MPSKDKEKARASCRLYKASHREEIRIKDKIWRSKNRTTENARMAKYQRRHAARVQAKNKAGRYYIKRLLIRFMKVKPADVPDSLIELKREHLKLERQLNHEKC